ncbi:MAG TPA: hypothetical protein VE465_02610 [Streptosporangiaceae bacterium]|jgi:hypothetical protein|nr:hypothetical protein [Streptosporangiaceae bacterium]
MDEPVASPRTRTEPRAESDGADDAARGAERVPGGQVMSRTPTSGAKGFAVILGAMVGIIGLLWLITALVAPH